MGFLRLGDAGASSKLQDRSGPFRTYGRDIYQGLEIIAERYEQNTGWKTLQPVLIRTFVRRFTRFRCSSVMCTKD
jgi:hypothetical protein